MMGSPHQRSRPIGARDLWALSGVGLLLALAWRLADVLLAVFAAVLVALLLDAAARVIERRARLSRRWALPLVVAALIGGLTAFAWLAGAAAAEQLQALRETLPRAWRALEQWLSTHAGGRQVLDTLRSLPNDWSGLGRAATGTFGATVGAIAAVALVLVLAIALAADPNTYRRGALALVPALHRARAATTLDAALARLSGWLLGQGVSMLIVGAVTAMALQAIGMPLAWTLGVVAGVLEFVPYFGSIVASVLIVAVAFGEGERMALSALIVCVVVQQAEAVVVQPLTQRWAVRLAPGLSIVSVFTFSILFGLPGAMLAVPLMVLTLVLVERLVVEPDTLPAMVVRADASAVEEAQAVDRRHDRPTGT